MSLRDGGTTSITVTGGLVKRTSYTIDYSLPHDGRKRYVFKGPAFSKEDEQRLEIGGDEENMVRRWLSEVACTRYGSAVVQEFLAGRRKNPARGKWFYAMNFLLILTKERGQEH
jgi:hypothetical protein